MFLDIPVEKITFIAIAGLGFIIAIITVKFKKITWGQARYMGLTKVDFVWMKVVYGLVLFAGGYGIVSTIMDWPVWTDIAITLIIFLLCIAMYFSLKSRGTFKAGRFIALFLIPFSIPGIGGVVKAISKAPTQEIVRYSEPVIDVLKKEGRIVLENLGQRTSKTTDAIRNRNVAKGFSALPGTSNTLPIRRLVPGSGYTVVFPNTQAMGKLGDNLTADWLTRRNDGYLEIKSKTDRIHGIDGVYIKRVGNDIEEIRVMENKVGAAKLHKDQMTRVWIDTRIKNMIASGDSELRKTGKLLQEHRSLVRPELWRYDLFEPGKSRFSVLDPNAMIRHETTKYLPSEFIEESIKRMCKSKSLTCEKQ